MNEEQDLPIALRRTPRASFGIAAPSPAPQSEITSAVTTHLRTPSKPKSKKRVRFSDPGPDIERHDASSTGLTPMVRRSSLGAAPSPKRRRNSAPLRKPSIEEEDELSGNGNNNNIENEIRIRSLRQVLDDRVKRRIRRNGLSEEMNTIHQDKRRHARDQGAELQRLKDELAEKDEEIERLQNTTMALDTDRIMELEHEIEVLRKQLRTQSTDEEDRTQCYDWTMAARDPFSDSYMDDEDFGDTTMAELVCSTPSRARASFPTPPCTSPVAPETPCSMRKAAPVTPPSHVGVQVSFPDPEKEAVEAELGSLRLELAKLTDTLESHAAFKTRVADKLVTGIPKESESSDVETHIDSVLQALSDRTAALLDLNASLSSLGFPGNDAGEIVASIAGAFRSARLELEYLTPGEIVLPLSSHGAEVLDLALSRLRDLARKVREDDDAIDEYHALELSLRQQLGARVEAMDSLRSERQRDQSRLREQSDRISDLEVGIDRLKGATEGYRRDIAELESLVQRMEEEGKTAEARLRTEADSAKGQVAERTNAAAELDSKLAAALAQTEDLGTQLRNFRAQKKDEIRALNRSHGGALALRDARVSELRREIDAINGSLREAHGTIQQLRVENLGLNRRVDEEKKRAKEAVDSMKAELERVLQMSSDILATPKKTGGAGPVARRTRSSVRNSKETTPDSALRPGGYFSGELAKGSKGKKRRKYDSGLGFLDEDEDSVEMV
ncbi:hypothetical protein F4779DRAFT_576438 [Xylariaceae sp. FL0662B]|nr:hypothetical protein F4779DRAFT_576438 [Xylariaceae sp. FL0662B]